jgi:predicted DsbA family dithiol-disulfide isomerase
MISLDTNLLLNGYDKSSPATLQVDVIADLICPWCYLGKRRLDAAMSAVHGPSLIGWYPFQINPTMPRSGMPFAEYLEKRFASPLELQSAMDELKLIGEVEGIQFDFERLARVPNTLDAHRLMKLAETEKIDTTALAESILSAFFEKSLDIGDRDVLIELGNGCGLSRTEISETLDNDTSRQIVLAQEAEVRQSGVSGVPNFLINKRLLAIGAQSTEKLVGVFDRAMFGEESDLSISPIVH